MKTKEEILKQEWYKVTSAPFNSVTLHHLSYALEAMRLYSDQQNKELREQWKQAVEFAATKGAENTRLTKEVEELRGENGELESKNIALEQAVDAFNYEIIKRDGIIKENARISELMSSDIQRLRELLDKSLPHVKKCKGSDSELVKEINNQLNPKP